MEYKRILNYGKIVLGAVLLWLTIKLIVSIIELFSIVIKLPDEKFTVKIAFLLGGTLIMTYILTNRFFGLSCQLIEKGIEGIKNGRKQLLEGCRIDPVDYDRIIKNRKHKRKLRLSKRKNRSA